ncbi:MBL fold metallo-hydrolase [Pseudoduganella sp. UC29_106]|uniref:MBL fold metallo-hydrolase n=1 Tax=Pseudoduganella sp. UC29_106 TaxID=3374553 RepID=UPI0037575A57
MTSLTLNRPTLMPSLRSGRKFRNAARMRKMGVGETLKIMWKVLFSKPDDAEPRYEISVRALTSAELIAAPDNTVYRLGHSTVLLKLNNQFWLTDPVFSERASPVQWAGPSRFHQPPIGIEELPPIKGVILSHNHYDHLDQAAVLKLAAKTEHFIAPLGVGDTLVKWGVPAEKVRQLDWWQSTVVGGLALTATPAQHFSGRTPFDGNETLWSSWVIDTGSYRIFFSGDSGYFKGFKEIGDQFGPFDLTLMETGAYDPMWPDVHMQPEETMLAHLDLRGKVLMPIHNGTFDLAMHSWHDPFERITALAAEHEQVLATPAIGEPLSVAAPAAAQPWWRDHE